MLAQYSLNVKCLDGFPPHPHKFGLVALGSVKSSSPAGGSNSSTLDCAAATCLTPARHVVRERRGLFESTIIKKLHPKRVKFLFLLGKRDSDPRSWNQNPLPYHLAIPQFYVEALYF